MSQMVIYEWRKKACVPQHESVTLSPGERTRLWEKTVKSTDLVAFVNNWWEQRMDENVATLTATKDRSCAGLCMCITEARKRLFDLIPYLESDQYKGNRQTQNYISEASVSFQVFCMGGGTKFLIVIKIILEWPKRG